jgi:hypothetical protein
MTKKLVILNEVSIRNIKKLSEKGINSSQYIRNCFEHYQLNLNLNDFINSNSSGVLIFVKCACGEIMIMEKSKMDFFHQLQCDNCNKIVKIKVEDVK